MKKSVNNSKLSENPNEKGRADRTKYPPTDYLPKEERIITDPLGSWTGVPIDDVLDKPVQDVDDL